MTHPHHHAAGSIEVGRVPRLITYAILAIAAVATVAGLWHWWPDPAKAPHLSPAAAFGASGVTFPHGTVSSVQPACRPTAVPTDGSGGPTTGYVPSPTCGNAQVTVGGSSVKVAIPPEVSKAGLASGDGVQLVRMPAAGGQPANYSFYGMDRRMPLLWLGLIFLVAVVAVARLRGVMAIVGFAFGGTVVLKFMLPALLAGEPGSWVALTSASAIMFVVLYTTHGFSLRTSVALVGTLAGVAISATTGWIAIDQSRLTGVGDETASMLAGFVPTLNLSGVLTCGLILAGLGVLNDVTVTQASAVWELREAGPDLSRRRIYSGAMRIGRDHIASTIYTIVFAYAGASLAVLMLLVVYKQPVGDLISQEALSEEIVRTLASAIGLVLAVPITTAIAAAVASPRRHLH